MVAVNDARVAEEIVDIVERVTGVVDAVDVVEVMDDEIAEETVIVRDNDMQYVNKKKKFDLRFKKKVALIPQENKKKKKLEKDSKDVWNAKLQNWVKPPSQIG